MQMSRTVWTPPFLNASFLKGVWHFIVSACELCQESGAGPRGAIDRAPDS